MEDASLCYASNGNDQASSNILKHTVIRNINENSDKKRYKGQFTQITTKKIVCVAPF